MSTSHLSPDDSGLVRFAARGYCPVLGVQKNVPSPCRIQCHLEQKPFEFWEALCAGFDSADLAGTQSSRLSSSSHPVPMRPLQAPRWPAPALDPAALAYGLGWSVAF